MRMYIFQKSYFLLFEKRSINQKTKGAELVDLQFQKKKGIYLFF